MMKFYTKNSIVIFCIALSMFFLESKFSLSQNWRTNGNNAWPPPNNINAASYIGSNTTVPLQLRTTLAQPILFQTNGAANERMRITPTGRVGIGTTSPQAKLESSDNSFQLRLSRVSGSANTRFLSDNNGYLRIIPSGGRVGINTTPTQPLDVNGRVRIRTLAFLSAAAGVVTQLTSPLKFYV